MCVFVCMYICVYIYIYIYICVLLISIISNRTILFLSGIQSLAEVCVLPEFLRCVIILLLLATAYKYRFLGAFTKLGKATIRFVNSVPPSARNLAPIGRIFIKSGTKF